MLSLFPRHHSRQAVFADMQRSLCHREFMGAARALARRLPVQSHCLNLCDSRLGFLLGYCAALLRNQCTLLPVSRTGASFADIVRRYPNITAISDGDAPPEGVNCLQLDETSFVNTPHEQDGHVLATALAAELYTSGSTGIPQAHGKTWGMLVNGAQQLAAELEPDGVLLGSVPSQHMFGLESTIMLPMQAGLTLAGGCPLLPQDIQSAMRQLTAPVWWATTPMHLRACVQSGLSFPKLAGVVCATQTLSTDLAAAAETCFQAPLHEIYGCTETGAIGLRRPALDESWHLLPDWEMERRGDRIWVSGPHSPQAIGLSDHIEMLPGRRFLLHGRHSSLIKVGGKRMHLEALNQLLLSLPGIRDGMFYQPIEGGRLTAFVVADEPDSAALLKALRREIDPVFLPRPIHWVESLPRNAVGKLPLDAFQQLLDRLGS